ncbi:MAG: hypothetical protein RIS85_1397, partial [Pseudomonadota bacterium]
QNGVAGLRQTHAFFGKAGFKLAKHDIGSAQGIGGTSKAGIVIIAIHRKVASGQDGMDQDILPDAYACRVRARLAVYDI